MTPSPAPNTPPQAQAARFTATGPGGQRLGTQDGQNWFDLATGRPYAAAPAASAAPPPQSPTGAQPGMTPPTARPGMGIPNWIEDPRILASEVARLGGSLASVQGIYQQGLENLTRVSKLTSDQAANELEKLGRIKGATTGYLTNPTPEGYKTYHDFVTDTEPKLAGTLPPPQAGQAPSAQDLAHVAGLTGATEQLLANQHVKAQIKESEATAAKTGVEGDLARFKLGLLKNAQNVTPDSIAQGVRGMTIFAGHPGEMQDAIDAGTRAYQAALTADPLTAAEKSQEAIKGVADRLRENSPGVIAGKAASAKATAQATAPVQEAIQAASQARENAYRQGDTASAKYYESLTDAKKAEATAHTIQTVVDLSRSGNPIAGQQLKAIVPEFTNAMQDIKRMAGAQNNEGMSTAFQKAIGELKSLGDGVPLSKDTIDAISPYIETIANGAIRQHNANVEALGQAYPQKKFSKEPLPNQSATGPGGHRILSHDGGRTWVDAQTGAPVK